MSGRLGYVAGADALSWTEISAWHSTGDRERTGVGAGPRPGRTAQSGGARFLGDPVAQLLRGFRQLAANRPDRVKLLAGDPAPRQHRNWQMYIEFRFHIGYSGWRAGRFDAEIERGSGRGDAVFAADSDSLWQRPIERLEPPGIEVRDRRPRITEAAAQAVE